MTLAPLRKLLRLVATGAILVACVVACSIHPVGHIVYVPGKGYIVRAEENRNKFEVSYFVLPSAERAEEFYKEYYTQQAWPRLRPGEKKIEDGEPGFDELDRLYKSPPPVNDTTIPLAVPELPDPIPSIPQ